MNVKKAVYRELVKTDKHGNETYRTNKCRRCGGTGRVFWSGLMGSRCFECAGSGTVEEYRTVVYTPEQERLRDAKRRAKKLVPSRSNTGRRGLDLTGSPMCRWGTHSPCGKRCLQSAHTGTAFAACGGARRAPTEWNATRFAHRTSRPSSTSTSRGSGMTSCTGISAIDTAGRPAHNPRRRPRLQARMCRRVLRHDPAGGTLGTQDRTWRQGSFV